MALLDAIPTAGATKDVTRLEDLLRRHSDAAFVLFADKARGNGPIVAAVDASPGGRATARLAQAVAEELDAELVLVHVPPPGERLSTPAAVRRRRRAHERIVANARRVTGHARVVPIGGGGTDEQRLLAFARARGARLLIAPSGRRGLAGWLAGDVAAGAPSPVIVMAQRR